MALTLLRPFAVCALVLSNRVLRYRTASSRCTVVCGTISPIRPAGRDGEWHQERTTYLPSFICSMAWLRDNIAESNLVDLHWLAPTDQHLYTYT